MSDLIAIRKGNQSKISENYTEAQWFSKDPTLVGSVIYIDPKLIEAVEFLNDLTGHVATINSTARTEIRQASLSGGSKNSQHVYYDKQNKVYCSWAVDIDYPNDVIGTISKFKDELIDPKFDDIKGFGVYKGFIHLDTGKKPGAIREKKAVWGDNVDPSAANFFKDWLQAGLDDEQDGSKKVGMPVNMQTVFVGLAALYLMNRVLKRG